MCVHPLSKRVEQEEIQQKEMCQMATSKKSKRVTSSRFFGSLTRISLLAIVMGTLTTSSVFAAVSGAIYTTNKTATIVNGNTQYAAFTEVYISGGPPNLNDAGLQDGVYY